MTREEHLRKLSDRFRQNAKVLVAKPEFQKDIVALRAKWNIPKKGFSNDKEYGDWDNNFLTNTDAYFDAEFPKHYKELDKLRNEGKYKEFRERQKELNDASPLNAFRIEIKNLVRKYHLSPRWEESIRRYTFFNNPKYMGHFIGIGIRIERDSENDVETILLEIDENTTLNDIKSEWPIVKFHQNRLSYKKQKKFQPIPNFDRDRRVYELKISGVKSKDIEEIIQNEFGSSISYADIDMIVKRYKKRLNIN